MSNLVNVKGLDELQKLLDKLPAKLEANVMRGALRAGMKPVLAEAKENVSSVSGKLRDGMKIATKKKGGLVISRLRALGEHGHVANWVEFGTDPHFIPGPLLLHGGKWVKGAKHPGAEPKPFMRPALDSQKGQALRETGEYIKRRLSTKHGIDTSHINLDGDD